MKHGYWIKTYDYRYDWYYQPSVYKNFRGRFEHYSTLSLVIL